jgi:hypothetical protein
VLLLEEELRFVLVAKVELGFLVLVLLDEIFFEELVEVTFLLLLDDVAFLTKVAEGGFVDELVEDTFFEEELVEEIFLDEEELVDLGATTPAFFVLNVTDDFTLELLVLILRDEVEDVVGLLDVVGLRDDEVETGLVDDVVGLLLDELVVGLKLDELVVGLVLDELVTGLMLVVLIVLVEGLIDEEDELERLVLESIEVEDDVELGRDDIDEEDVDDDRTLLDEDGVERLADEDEREMLVEDVDRIELLVELVELAVELLEDVEDVGLIKDEELEVIGSWITVSENTLM